MLCACKRCSRIYIISAPILMMINGMATKRPTPGREWLGAADIVLLALREIC